MRRERGKCFFVEREVEGRKKGINGKDEKKDKGKGKMKGEGI